MFKNYFKIAFRNLLRSKGFSAINICGLSIGMASAVLILLWIQNEISYDQFHTKKDRIYEAWNRGEFSGKLQSWSTTPKILARTLEANYPEIETAVRVDWPRSLLFVVGDKRLSITGNAVDSTFFRLFDFPMLKGQPEQALKEMHSIVITEKLAKKLFGKEEPMGKQILIDNKDNYTVTAVLKDLPNNTRFNFEYLLPWSYVRKQGNDDQNWGNNSTRNYVLLKPGASIDAINAKMKDIRKRFLKDDPDTYGMFLYPISRWRLYSSFEGYKETGGLIEFVRMFAIIAAFILLIACINFMNLSTARSERRAKEVGIRKVVGANRRLLISQFIGESVLISFIAGLLALFFVQLSLPSFNSLTGKQLFIDYTSIRFWLFFLAFILLTGILAGSYPAFYLSSFMPVQVLKGTFRKTQALITPRKILVVLQFTFATILIICTIVVKQQIQYAKDRERGYRKDNLVYHMTTGDINKNYLLIRNELLSSGTAAAVTKTSAPLTQGWSDSWGFEWEGKDPKDKTDFDRFTADEGFANTVGLQMVMGRDFNLKEFPTDSTGMLINESALKTMNFKDPIGKIVKDGSSQWHIVGVFKDFILHSPYHPTSPMLVMGAKSSFVNVIHFRLSPQHTTAENLKAAEKIFKKYNPNYPFEIQFIDEDYATKFKAEQRTGTLAALFAGLTIFISCLGLFGLAAYMAEARIKEIGVRKVLGASIASITTLLSKDFIKLVLVSFLLAAPVAWWGMFTWLQKYPYRVQIEWWVFLFTVGLSLSIALLTVSYHAIRAARANPVKSLRSE